MLSDLNFDTAVVLRVLGVFSIVIGMSGLLGFWKRWYFRSKNNTVYGYPLLGLLCFLVSYEDYILANLISREWILITIYIIVMVLVMWISYSPPAFLKPRFVKRIEQEPNAVYQKMAKHVIQEDKPWRDKAKNMEALDKWIRQVKRTIR
ncbi:hypothetical protein KQH62_02665 [bacterium]|nr:hypothetical protein [bacterium]